MSFEQNINSLILIILFLPISLFINQGPPPGHSRDNVLDNMVRFRFYNPEIFQKMQNHLSTAKVSTFLKRICSIYAVFNCQFFIADSQNPIKSKLIFLQDIGKFRISNSTFSCEQNNENSTYSCSDLSVEGVTYMESGLYSCTDKRASKTALVHKVEWQTCGNDDNKKINRQIATITSTSLYVFVKGKFFIQNNNTPYNNLCATNLYVAFPF